MRHASSLCSRGYRARRRIRLRGAQRGHCFVALLSPASSSGHPIVRLPSWPTTRHFSCSLQSSTQSLSIAGYCWIAITYCASLRTTSGLRRSIGTRVSDCTFEATNNATRSVANWLSDCTDRAVFPGRKRFQIIEMRAIEQRGIAIATQLSAEVVNRIWIAPDPGKMLGKPSS